MALISVFFYYFATILSLSLLAIAVLIGLIKRNFFRNGHSWLLGFFVFVLLTELTSNILIQIKFENLFIYPFYIGGECFFLTALLFRLNKFSMRFLWLSSVGAVAITFESFYLYLNGDDFSSTFGILFSNFSIIVLSAYYLIKELHVANTIRKNRLLPVYICIFLYYSVALFLSLLLPQIATSPIQQSTIVWGINNLLSSILYSTAIISFISLK